MHSLLFVERRNANLARVIAGLLICSHLRAADNTPTVTINWSALTSGQQACVPSTSNPSLAKITITNANVILYTYSAEIQSYEIPSNDAGNFPAAANIEKNKQGQPPPPKPDCQVYVNSLRALWKDERLFPPSGKSIPLDATQAALSDKADSINQLVSNSSCSLSNSVQIPQDLIEANRVVLTNVQTYQSKNANISSTGTSIDFLYQVDNKHYTTFRIREQTQYNGRFTSRSIHWRCGLDDVLTLSLGAMFTTLAYRTYDHQAVPTASGTQDRLVVNGNSSWNPQGLALLNYKLWNADKAPQPGFALSTGPAFKFGGSPSVSSFGWFAGLSFSIWRRCFISAGMHLGQFADFPPGFANGTPIPANFGQLTPTTRWSGRFAIGLTVQTNSFVKSDKGSGTTSDSVSSKASQNGSNSHY